MARPSPRGQALVEFGLLLPLLLLVLVGGLYLGIMIVDKVQLNWITSEGAQAAAAALTDAERCPAAISAIEAVSGRSYALCDGSGGLRLVVDPITSVPRAVRVTIVDQLGAPPLIQFATDGTVSATAGAVIEALP